LSWRWEDELTSQEPTETLKVVVCSALDCAGAGWC
jgi:hypothetical protein